MLTRRRCCCGGPPPPADCFSCFPGSPPGPLTLTDDNATITLNWVGSIPFDYRWGGLYAWSTTGVQSVFDAGSECVGLTIGTITRNVAYQVVCAPKFGVMEIDVIRNWLAIYVIPGCPDGGTACGPPDTATSSQFSDNSIAISSFCTVLPEWAQPVGVGTSGSLIPTSCSPLSVSGTLNPPASPLVDPAPGTVIITSTRREDMEEWLASDDPRKRRHAAYRIMVMDDPGKATGHLTREGEFVRGDGGAKVSTFVMPAPDTEEDRKLREYLARHGGCCGGAKES
jgi:hypothetical protein